MKESVRKDWDWSRQFLPAVKAILGLHLIAEAPAEEDEKHNTDLIVLRLNAVRIAVRLRKFQYFGSFGGQFTLRLNRPSGKECELAKIIAGWGDYFFYGFGDDGELRAWSLMDLKVFRLWHARQLYKKKDNELVGKLCENGDGSSKFLAFRFDEMPEDFVVAFDNVKIHPHHAPLFEEQ